MRIISTVPSITELLYTLGLGDQVVGITKFCVHPSSWYRAKPRIGGTKTLNFEKINDLQPDLIIANKEENTQDQIERLAQDYEILITDVNNLPEALEMIKEIGIATHTENIAGELYETIQNAFSLLLPTISYPAAYLIWKDPIMTVGADTFIHDMMGRCGLRNVFGTELRYPQIDMDLIKEKAPELLLLSSEPYPFKQQHADYFAAELPHTKIMLVDGEYFSWYGSRMVAAATYFQGLMAAI